ncbi:hypothetical protein P9597_30775 [Aneurinibacillus migulanus]|uniref:hypothetical protein n=1 Tax=Aneurinibacillus migulanus TaxID=47500 RepID=UPI002E1E23E3|nr:hypothetical protein [Aneurinibacillus migulanus]
MYHTDMYGSLTYMNEYTHPIPWYTSCRQYLHRYVRITTKDGNVYDGFIADVNPENVTLAIPTCEAEGADDRQFGFGRRRFRRLALPLFLLSSLFLLPFFGGGFPYWY